METMLHLSRWLFWGPLRKMVSLISPWHLFVLENLFSSVSYYILVNRRRMITQELIRSFGSEWSYDRVEKAVRGSFWIYFVSKFRLFFLNRLNSSNTDKFIDIEGVDFLENELKKKRGVIILNPHFGPFMLIMPGLAYRGYSVSQMALQETPVSKQRKWMDKKAYANKFRTIECNMPVKFINPAQGISSLRKAYKVLKDNEILLYPSTGRGGSLWYPVNFMNRKALFSPAPFKMALKTGASLLPAFVFCRGQKVLLKFERPIGIDHESSAEGLLEEYVKVVDAYVYRYPEHFLDYIYLMRIHAYQDDHPFFNDYRDHGKDRNVGDKEYR